MSGLWNKILGLFGFQNEEPEHHHHHHHHHDRSSETLTRTQRLARSQVEFYFSPSNVMRNVFMKNLIDDRDDRYCPISTIMSFNKILELNISEEDFVNALRTSRKLEVNSEGTHVRSKEPFKPDPRIDFKTLLIKGIDPSETQDTIRSKLEEQFGKVIYIQMYKNKDKQGKKVFSGRIDVELPSESKAKDAQESGFSYNDEILPATIIGYMKGDEKTPQKEKSFKKKTPRSARPKTQE